MNITMDGELMERPEQSELNIIRDNVTAIIEEARNAYDYKGCKVLEIGLLKGGAKDTFVNADVKTLDIVEGGDYCFDLCSSASNACLRLSDQFDCIICTEVLEHVRIPFEATFGIKLMLKKGGRAYVTTPYNFRIHNPLPDNWRFTEHGLRQLFANFTVEELRWVGGYELNPICYRLIARK